MIPITKFTRLAAACVHASLPPGNRKSLRFTSDETDCPSNQRSTNCAQEFLVLGTLLLGIRIDVNIVGFKIPPGKTAQHKKYSKRISIIHLIKPCLSLGLVAHHRTDLLLALGSRRPLTSGLSLEAVADQRILECHALGHPAVEAMRFSSEQHANPVLV